MTPKPGTPEERARMQLEEAFMDIAELMADADESRAQTYERCMAIRNTCEVVWKMAGLGEPPAFAISRKVIRTA